MDVNTHVNGLSGDPVVSVPAGSRRSFLKNLGGGAIAATALAAGTGGLQAKPAFAPLWDSGQVFIGNSAQEQIPNSVIQCPMFFPNGDFAHAYHGLDLSNPKAVRGTVTVHDDTIEPVFGPSIAVSVTRGFDFVTYLLVAGEGTITGGKGYFRNINTAIIRCKYKVPAGSNPQNPVLLISCVDCVVILARKANN
jgi:hypothetical protein